MALLARLLGEGTIRRLHAIDHISTRQSCFVQLLCADHALRLLHENALCQKVHQHTDTVFFLIQLWVSEGGEIVASQDTISRWSCNS